MYISEWSAVLFSLLLVVAAGDESCPTWFNRYSQDGPCECGSSIGSVITCNNETGEVGVLGSYCLTSNGHGHEHGCDSNVIGRCLVIMNHGENIYNIPKHYHSFLYIKVYPNISEQDRQTCGYLNRQGRLCGECKEHHYVSAYSYDMNCHKCTSGLWSSVVQYVCIAYLPLTVFLCMVVLLRISVTSPSMNALVFFCQMLALPVSLRYLVQVTRNYNTIIAINILATLYGIWNLDFFRSVVPPICLPLNIMQIIALDYLVAVYPLVLLVCFYVLLTAHDRGWRPVMWLWRPFHRCSVRMRQRWNLRHSIIDAFATFFLLSYMKLLSTSYDLMIYTNVYNKCDKWVGNFLYYDATIEYWGPQHMPYACLAIIVFLVGNLLPLALLLLYPMQWFQRCLNRYRLNCQALHIFMQCFQGYYRDRTDGGRECRYFAAFYPTFRIVAFIFYGVTLSNLFFVAFIAFSISVSITIVVVRPYKAPFDFYNKMDAVLMLLLAVLTLGFVTEVIEFDEKQVGLNFGYIISGVFSLTPLVYFTVKFYMLVKRTLLQVLPNSPRMERRHGYENLVTSPEAEPLTDNVT